MDNAQHTPGPWKWNRVADDRGQTLAMLLETGAPNPPHNDPVVMAVREDWHGYLDRSERGQANARLIAAAPDLLAALEAAHAVLVAVNGHATLRECKCHAAQTARRARGEDA